MASKRPITSPTICWPRLWIDLGSTPHDYPDKLTPTVNVHSNIQIIQIDTFRTQKHRTETEETRRTRKCRNSLPKTWRRTTQPTTASISSSTATSTTWRISSTSILVARRFWSGLLGRMPRSSSGRWVFLHLDLDLDLDLFEYIGYKLITDSTIMKTCLKSTRRNWRSGRLRMRRSCDIDIDMGVGIHWRMDVWYYPVEVNWIN